MPVFVCEWRWTHLVQRSRDPSWGCLSGLSPSYCYQTPRQLDLCPTSRCYRDSHPLFPVLHREQSYCSYINQMEEINLGFSSYPVVYFAIAGVFQYRDRIYLHRQRWNVTIFVRKNTRWAVTFYRVINVFTIDNNANKIHSDGQTWINFSSTFQNVVM